jgi:hypothetical protein
VDIDAQEKGKDGDNYETASHSNDGAEGPGKDRNEEKDREEF